MKLYPIAIIRGNDVPDDVAGLGIERDHVRVKGSHENFVAQNCETAIHAAAARTDVPRQLVLIDPDGPPGAGVQSKGTIVLRRGVENAVCNQRRGFELARGPGLVYPLRDKRMRVRGVDLIERTEAASGVIAGISQPVLRLFAGVEQAIECYLGMGGSYKKTAGKEKRPALYDLPSRRLRLGSFRPHADQVRHNVFQIFVTQ